MRKLDGKVAPITGSGRDIGRGTALKLVVEGAHFVVNARSNQVEAAGWTGPECVAIAVYHPPARLYDIILENRSYRECRLHGSFSARPDSCAPQVRPRPR
jgi:NAD(P)-dependent dehydrogenase (short-subunit alcohol dehydrogenase family)